MNCRRSFHKTPGGSFHRGPSKGYGMEGHANRMLQVGLQSDQTEWTVITISLLEVLLPQPHAGQQTWLQNLRDGAIKDVAYCHHGPVATSNGLSENHWVAGESGLNKMKARF